MAKSKEPHVWIAEKLSMSDKWEPQSMDTNRQMMRANVSAWYTAQGGRWRIRKYVPSVPAGGNE